MLKSLFIHYSDTRFVCISYASTIVRMNCAPFTPVSPTHYLFSASHFQPSHRVNERLNKQTNERTLNSRWFFSLVFARIQCTFFASSRECIANGSEILFSVVCRAKEALLLVHCARDCARCLLLERSRRRKFVVFVISTVLHMRA